MHHIVAMLCCGRNDGAPICCDDPTLVGDLQRNNFAVTPKRVLDIESVEGALPIVWTRGPARECVLVVDVASIPNYSPCT
jgi:hypothetical protein